MSFRRLAEHHALEAGGVALFGGDFEVAVDDTAAKLALNREEEFRKLT